MKYLEFDKEDKRINDNIDNYLSMLKDALPKILDYKKSKTFMNLLEDFLCTFKEMEVNLQHAPENNFPIEVVILYETQKKEYKLSENLQKMVDSYNAQ